MLSQEQNDRLTRTGPGTPLSRLVRSYWIPALLSEDVAAASRERLASLSALRQRSDAPADSGALEAVIRDMLRPMLKSWLDDNLPGMVERIVKAEIERVSRGRG